MGVKYTDYQMLQAILEDPDGGDPGAVFSIAWETGGFRQCVVIEKGGERRSTEHIFGLSLMRASNEALASERRRLNRLREHIDALVKDIDGVVLRRSESPPGG